MSTRAPVEAETIASRRNPVVGRCRSIARGDHAHEILLEGRHLLTEALRAGTSLRLVAIEARLLDDSRSEEASLARHLQTSNTRILRVTADVMSALSPATHPSGVIAVADRPSDDARKVLAQASVILAALDVQDPGNLGAMIRIVHAARVDACVACGTSADPYGWKALRGAMGSTFHVPVARVADALEGVSMLRELGMRLVATVPHGARSLYNADLASPVALLVGSEARGLPPAILERVDASISIPMAPGVNSLNVAATTSLVAYEFVRRRGAADDQR